MIEVSELITSGRHVVLVLQARKNHIDVLHLTSGFVTAGCTKGCYH
jgi:hypothetical protein